MNKFLSVVVMLMILATSLGFRMHNSNGLFNSSRKSKMVTIPEDFWKGLKVPREILEQMWSPTPPGLDIPNEDCVDQWSDCANNAEWCGIDPEVDAACTKTCTNC